MADNRKEIIMEKLGVDEQTAEEIIEFDRAIDRGERTEYDLPIEVEKMVQKTYVNAKTHKKPIALDKKPRERKANPTKASIISELAKFLTEQSENACENVEITNKERIIAFKIGDNRYEITLTQKRNPKS